MKMLDGLKKKYDGLSIVVKATFWFTVCSILQKSISMLTTPIFTRLLTTEEYGLYSAYLSWVNIFTVCVTLRLEAGTFNKGMAKFKEDRDGYTTAMQGLTTCLTSVALLVYVVFYKVFNNFTGLPTHLMLAMFLEIYCVPAYNFWIRRQRYDFKYRSVILVTLALTLSNAIVGILMVLWSSGDKGEAQIFSVVLVQVVCGLILYLCNLKRCKKLINLTYWKYALGFNLPLLPHYFSLYILQHSDRIMIQKYCGYTDVALYSVVYNLSMVLNTVVDSMNNAIVPWLYRELEEKHFDNIRKKLNVMILAVSGMLLVFILFAPEAIRILAPASYFEAIYIVPPVASSILFIFMYVLFGNIEFYYDYNKLTMFISIIGAALNLILNAIFIPRFGFVAAGYTTLFCYALFALMHCIFSAYITRKKEGLVIFDSGFLLIWCTLFVVIAILLSLIYAHTVLRYALVIGVLIICLINRKRLMEAARYILKK